MNKSEIFTWGGSVVLLDANNQEAGVWEFQSEANTIMGRNAKMARLSKYGGIMPKVRKLAAMIIRGRRKYRGRGF